MEELKKILKAHAAKYPAMEPTDAVKLIYQNEFGGGHLIADRQRCLEYLRREYEAVFDPEAELTVEPIGNGLVRVMLAGLRETGYSYEQLGEDFIRSASAHPGDQNSFLRKLEVLKILTEEGLFSFDSKQLADYLTEYMEKGCPAVSHSNAYRQAYQPAYRIVLQAYIPEAFR